MRRTGCVRVSPVSRVAARLLALSSALSLPPQRRAPAAAMSSVTLAAAPGSLRAHAPRVTRRAQRLPLQVRSDAAPQVRWQTMQVKLKVRRLATRFSRLRHLAAPYLAALRSGWTPAARIAHRRVCIIATGDHARAARRTGRLAAPHCRCAVPLHALPLRTAAAGAAA